MQAIKYERGKNFHQFARLPPEMRCRIWYLCLPRRIVEFDVLDGKMHTENHVRNNFDDHGHICECYQNFKVKTNRRPPLIMRVCREAYDVAASHGAFDTTGPLATWRQPGLDRMFFYHSKIPRRLCYGAYDRQYRSDTSRVHELDDTFAHARRINLPLAFYHLEIYAFKYEETSEFDGWKSVVFKPQMACIEAVAQSGLFGTLSEETCQLVPVEDASKIEEYYEF